MRDGNGSPRGERAPNESGKKHGRFETPDDGVPEAKRKSATIAQGPLGVLESEERRFERQFDAWEVACSDGSPRSQKAFAYLKRISFGQQAAFYFALFVPNSSTENLSIKSGFHVGKDIEKFFLDATETNDLAVGFAREGVNDKVSRAAHAIRDIIISMAIRRKNDIRDVKDYVLVVRGMPAAKPAFLQVWLSRLPEDECFMGEEADPLPEYMLTSPAYSLWWLALWCCADHRQRLGIFRGAVREFEAKLLRDYSAEFISYPAWKADHEKASSGGKISAALEKMASKLQHFQSNKGGDGRKQQQQQQQQRQHGAGGGGRHQRDGGNGRGDRGGGRNGGGGGGRQTQTTADDDDAVVAEILEPDTTANGGGRGGRGDRGRGGRRGGRRGR